MILFLLHARLAHSFNELNGDQPRVMRATHAAATVAAAATAAADEADSRRRRRRLALPRRRHRSTATDVALFLLLHQP